MSHTFIQGTTADLNAIFLCPTALCDNLQHTQWTLDTDLYDQSYVFLRFRASQWCEPSCSFDMTEHLIMSKHRIQMQPSCYMLS